MINYNKYLTASKKLNRELTRNQIRAMSDFIAYYGLGELQLDLSVIHWGQLVSIIRSDPMFIAVTQRQFDGSAVSFPEEFNLAYKDLDKFEQEVSIDKSTVYSFDSAASDVSISNQNIQSVLATYYNRAFHKDASLNNLIKCAELNFKKNKSKLNELNTNLIHFKRFLLTYACDLLILASIVPNLLNSDQLSNLKNKLIENNVAPSKILQDL